MHGIAVKFQTKALMRSQRSHSILQSSWQAPLSHKVISMWALIQAMYVGLCFGKLFSGLTQNNESY